MSPDDVPRRVNTGVALSAVCLGAAGALLLFVPDDASVILVPGAAGGKPLVQVLGAALLGLAATNWTAKGAGLGGIYGRAVVVGNQTHLTIGAMLLLTWGVTAGTAPPAFWVLTGLYVVGAGFFNYLTFFSSGLPQRWRARP